jgi:hypothetical protein
MNEPPSAAAPATKAKSVAISTSDPAMSTLGFAPSG